MPAKKSDDQNQTQVNPTVENDPRNEMQAREDGLPVENKTTEHQELVGTADITGEVTTRVPTYVPQPHEVPLDHAAILAKEDALRAEYLEAQRRKDLEPARTENDAGWTVQHANSDRMQEEEKAYKARQAESKKNSKK